MDKNNFRYCTLLLINNDNHSKIFVSEKNKYYIRSENKSIHIQILNEFKDIRKSHKINFFDTTNICYKIDDITHNYYKINRPHIIKNCTILLIDDDDHSKIFISEKNLYYTSNDCDYFGFDVNDYELFDENYKFFDEDNEDYDYYGDDYDDDYYKEVNDDYDDDDDDFYDKLHYRKPFNHFERLLSVKNNIVNLINNDNHNHNITLLVDNLRIFICKNAY